MIYEHRNGETEPPTIAGEYWFDGVIASDNKNDPKWYGVGKRLQEKLLAERYSDGSIDFEYGEYMDGRGALFDPWQLVGRWWGPIVPPWEEGG